MDAYKTLKPPPLNFLIMDNTDKKALEKFNTYLNAEPNPTEVFENKHAGNTRYLPISFLEMELDQIYFGLWETRDFKTTVIGNEIAGTLTLRVYHPVANVWIERTGAAATMIRTAAGMPPTADNKIKNAIEMDYPHLLSDCFRNACLHLGKRFGRDLNRKYADHYRPLLAEAESRQGNQQIPAKLSKEAKEISDAVDANALTELYHKYQDNGKLTPEIAELFKQRNKQLHAARTL